MTPASSWSPADMPDLTGRTAVVTGANSGLGLEAAKALAGKGAHVILGARDPARGAAAATEVEAHGSAELLRLDLADLADVARAATLIASRHERIDLLVNNAGVMATPHRTSVDGLELQMATNHLGHFALTGRLMPLLLAAPDPRVVNVSSLMHRLGRQNAADPLGERTRYHAWPAYGRSKLANLLFTMELQRRADAAGERLLSIAAHPGVANTHLIASGPARRIPGVAQAATFLNGLWAQPAALGVWPILFAGTRAGLVGGEFVGPSGLGEMRGPLAIVRATDAAYDEGLARALWHRSVELTGVGFEALSA